MNLRNKIVKLIVFLHIILFSNQQITTGIHKIIDGIQYAIVFDANEEYYIRKKRKLFPLFYYFMDAFINKLHRPQNFCCLDKKYLIVYNFMDRIFNISSYILLYKNFNIYKTIFSKELKDFNFQKFEQKFNINNDELMNNIEQKIFSNDNKENNEIFSKTIIYD